jgi:hypothetical protein
MYLSQLHTSFSNRHNSEINLSSRPGNVRTPMMRINRILLVNIYLEELVMCNTFVILETTPPSALTSYATTNRIGNLRVQFLEIGINKPLLHHFDKLVIALDEVPLALQRAIVDLPNNLNSESNARRFGCGGDGAFSRVLGPSHEGAELWFVG